MLKYFFILTLRSWMREAKITLINLLGLSLGLAAAILLYLYIMHEYSFENMHTKRENIHRLYTKVDGQDGGQAPFSSGFENPVGQEVILHTLPGEIIGVVKDFHFESRHSPIKPLVFTRFLDDFQRIAIKTERYFEILLMG